MSKTAPVPAEDFQSRVDAFLKEYVELTKKYEIDYASYPVYVPDGNKGKFDTLIQTVPVDMRLKKLNESFVAK